ncbi:hypothetical protein AB6A40_006741 [Gnathostoma spinigerum]|uniref:Uncharacterized protein n=1 Tax=Gnathostoma spinigerum TaxID=75299 RepID=A0ABD6EU07_9BILA
MSDAYRLPQDKYKLANLPFLFFQTNPKASDWMLNYFKKYPKDVLSSGHLAEYLEAMTASWFTDQRSDQLKKLYDATKDALTQKQNETFKSYQNKVDENIKFSTKFYRDIVDFMREKYDR